jgi:outer membrane receptor protein involved in Fe transport
MILALVLSLALAQAGAVSGIVRDQSGGVVAGASIVVRAASGAEQQTVTGPDGRFVLERAPDGQATLVVRAGGFAVKEQPISGSTGDLEIVLVPASLTETVMVTPLRGIGEVANIPASMNVLDNEEIRQSPAIVADDVLRRLPAFSLFRRTSSLSSHPTAQGVSLRGIGPSGVSRTLVMVDNVPFNDPFGGWVYWTRVPMESVDRIEVVDGSNSSLYGNYAMGGVINIVSNRPAPRTFELRTQYGNLNSPKLDFFGSDVYGKVGFAVDGSFFDTEGFPIVIENERGAVDTKAAVTFRNFSAKADYSPTANTSVFVRGGYFREERDNAKVSTIDGTPEANDTTWKYISGGTELLLPDSSAVQARLFADFETFDSNFLAVPAATPPRSIGRMTLNQHVPTTNFGGMVQWARAFGLRHYVSAGTDFRRVDGDSEEDALDPIRGQTVTLHRVSGGTQRSIGAYVQDVFTPVEKLVLTLSVRVDNWRNYDAHNFETLQPSGVPGPGNKPTLPDKENTVGSPRVAALYHVNDQVSVWGDYSQGFRAPTLNELYRQFRVGTVLTLANENLGPERLQGGEIGVRLQPIDRMSIRSTYYDNRVKDPVSNVTQTVVGTAVTQQRQNLGRTRIRGWQTDAEYRVGTEWRVSGGYLFNDATIREYAANPALVGNYLPQVPRHRGSFHVAYTNPRYLNVAVGTQFFGRQYDDDANVRTVPGESEPGLPAYGILDFTASRSITRNFEAFFGVQNLLDKEYIVGTLPTTIGSPRLVHGGIRVRFTGR